MAKMAERGFPCKKCFPVRHMSAPEFRIYDYMVAYATSARTGRFTVSVRPKLCNELNVSPNSAREIIESLHESGWLVLHGRKRRADGTETPNAWEPVSHENFVLANPGSCPPYLYCPDYETAKQYGIAIGDKLPTGTPQPVPFWKGKLYRFGRDVAAWWDGMTDRDHEEIIEHLKTVDPDPVLWSPAITGNPVQVATTGNPVPAEEGTITGIPVEPLPENRSDHYRKTGVAITGNPVGSLIPTVPETQTTTTTPPKPPTVLELSSLTKTKTDAIVEETIAWMQESFIKKDNGRASCPMSKAHKKELVQLVMKYGAPFAKAAWFEYLQEESWNNLTLWPAAKFIAEFAGYLATAENKESRSLLMTKARRHLLFGIALMPQFKKSIPADEQKLHERFMQWHVEHVNENDYFQGYSQLPLTSEEQGKLCEIYIREMAYIELWSPVMQFEEEQHQFEEEQNFRENPEE